MLQARNLDPAQTPQPALPLGWNSLTSVFADLPAFAVSNDLKATFSLPESFPSGRVIAEMRAIQYKVLREHWRHLVQTNFPVRPSAPLQSARLVVVRYGIRELQLSNLVTGMKPLLNVLMQQAKAYPDGLGIVDNNSFDAPVVAQMKVSRGQERTDVYLFAP